MWTADGQLDVVVLGPMKGQKKSGTELSNCKAIRAVTRALLREKSIQKLLNQAGFATSRVAFPEGWQGNHIEENVFLAIDQADLVIFDMSGKDDESSPSPNVMYELGMAHALGLPYLLVEKAGVKLPFYLRQTQHIVLPEAGYPDAKLLKPRLREKLKAILDPADTNSFETNPVSRHYDEAALVDISASMGLASGFYSNFLYRMLGDPDYLKVHRDRFDRIVTLVPNSIRSTAEKQIDDFKKLVEASGLRVQRAPLEPPADRKDIRAIDVYFIGRSCFDIPTTVFALKQSPRYVKREDRAVRLSGSQAEAELYRMEQRLLQQFSGAVGYLLQRAHRMQGLDIADRHVLTRIPTTVDQVRALFG